MTLTPGTKLGPYEIVAPLGAGGMGEVYRARDPRLGRDVAIKALPEAFARDPERLARFEREAKLLASLSHPNVAGIHGVEQVEATRYLVLEFVDGETLAARLSRGALSPADAAEVCRQIAAGVEAAHESGVVHRDLKPGNVMLKSDGTVKVLDFGLAKAGATERASSSDPSLSASPTMTYAATSAGVILGTAAYMSPEQARGRAVDRRTDIWSFGCVLYECLSGRQAFAGETVSDMIARILQSEPDWSALPAATPPWMRSLLQRCLTKDVKLRLQAVGEARIALERGGADEPVVAATPARGTGRSAWVPWALAVVALGALAATVWWRGSSGGPGVLHAALMPPAGGEFSSSFMNPLPLAVSPDGSRIVYCARIGEGADRLWVRSLDSPEPRALSGTENASAPFFSPDGRSIGFFADGRLKRVDVAGGPVIVLAEVVDPRGGSWGRDGTIVFSPGSGQPLFRVSADGGAVAAATSLDSTLQERTHRYPVFLPDGRRFLYLARRAGAGRGQAPAIYAASLDSPKRTKVLEVASNVAYASGHLLYVRDAILLAQPFDARRLVTTGPAVPLVEDLRWDERFSRGVFAVSRDGILAFMTGKAQARTQLAWLDRSGRVLERIGEPADYTYGGTPEISPDGGRAAMAILNPDRGNSDAFVVDLDTGRRSRLTVDESDHPACIWSHDGQSLVVNANAVTGTLLRQRIGGTSADTLIRAGSTLWPESASPDGRYLLYGDEGGRDGSDVLAVPLSGPATPVPVATGTASEGNGGFSPDGRLVAYESDESGRREVYVVTFPEPGGKWQVSQDGGSEARWSRDGRELFFVDPDNRIVSVEVVRSGEGFHAGATRPLFHFHGVGGIWRYDVSRDGTRFLVTLPPEGESTPPVSLMTDWTARLRKR